MVQPLHSRAFQGPSELDPTPVPHDPHRPPPQPVPRDASQIPDVSHYTGPPPGRASGGRAPAVSGSSVSGPSPGATRAIQSRLDAFRARATPVYRTSEGDVPVATPFRMTGGYPVHEATTVAPQRAVVRDVARSIGLSDGEVQFILQGRGTPTQVQRLTQGLIDAGHLPSAQGSLTLAARVRQMMFDHGIGIDCAGYARQAFVAAHPGARVQWRAPVNEDLSGLAGRGFTRMRLSDARAGDLVVLKPVPGQIWGHTLIVYDAHEATEADRARLAEPAKRDRDVAAIADSGCLHVVVVDSSWGCDGSAERGGVQQVTWFEDRVSGRWLSIGPNELEYRVADSPYGHPVEGVYRLREGGP